MTTNTTERGRERGGKVVSERLKMTDKESERQGQRDGESRMKEEMCRPREKNKDPAKNVN